MKGIIDHIKSTATKVYIGPKDEGVGSPRGRYHYADGSMGDVSKVAPTIDLVLSALDTGSHWNPDWARPQKDTREDSTLVRLVARTFGTTV